MRPAFHMTGFCLPLLALAACTQESGTISESGHIETSQQELPLDLEPFGSSPEPKIPGQVAAAAKSTHDPIPKLQSNPALVNGGSLSSAPSAVRQFSETELPEFALGRFTVEDDTPQRHGDRLVPRTLRHTATGLIFLYVPSGSFTLGSDADDPDRFDDERPPHRIQMTGFYISATETTLEAWRNGGGEAGSGLGDLYPVTGVNWFEAQAWCADNGFALPTEAQWEYAASGSRNDLFPWGHDLRVKGRANASGTNEEDLWPETAPVGSFPEGTSWCGVQDLAGNVMEWCRDEWSADHSQLQDGATDPVFEPNGQALGAEHLVRGGSFESDSIAHLRCAYRNALLPSLAGANLGFRPVLPLF